MRGNTLGDERGDSIVGLKNCHIISPFVEIDHGYIFIKDGKILYVGNDMEIAEKEQIKWIDANGNFVFPGFINMHFHGINGRHFMETDYENLDLISMDVARSGMTGYLATTIGDRKETMIKRAKETGIAIKRGVSGARMLGIYFEGPYISFEKKGAAPDYRIRKPSVDEFMELKEASDGTLKMIIIAPELDGAIDCIKCAVKQNVVVSLGHTNATYDEFIKGVDAAGVRVHTTHTYNGMRGLHHREPGALGAIFLDNRVSAEVVCDFVHVHPKAIELLIKVKGIDNVSLITDGTPQTYLPDGEYTTEYGQDVVVSGGNVKLKDSGALAGSLMPMNEQFRNLVKGIGLPISDALKMAAVNPAKVLNIFSEFGSLEAGKYADIVIMNKDMEVLKTIVGGKIVYSK